MPGPRTEWSVGGIVRRMLPLLCALTGIELVSGLVLASFEAALLGAPSLLLLVPVTIGMAGNLGSVLAARLSTALHLGLLSFSPTDDRLVGNAAATVALSLTVFPLVGAGAWGLTALTGEPGLDLVTVVGIASLSGLCLAFVAVLVTTLTTYAAYRYRLDPDDVVVPVVTNVCDVLGVVVLFAVYQVVA